MKQRTVGKLGVILSVILFCIGVGVYSFAELDSVDKEKEVNLFSYVPADCIGVLETDNIELLATEFTQAAYTSQLDTLESNILLLLQDKFNSYISDNTHAFNNHINRVAVSFHSELCTVQNVVFYFRTDEVGKKFLHQMIREVASFAPKTEIYRGKKLDIYMVHQKDFITVYQENGFLALSYQKNLIEQVVDAFKNQTSLMDNEAFAEKYHGKAFNFITLYGRTAAVPLLSDAGADCWSEFDMHFNSEVFYLSGEVFEPDSCVRRMADRLENVTSFSSDSILLMAGRHQVDSCISSVIADSEHTLFEECISNLSRDASYIMVVDMDKVAREPQKYADYLPKFIIEHTSMFRPFILSIQVSSVNGHLSHIFVFTYKD